MKNYFNPQANRIDFRITVNIGVAYDSGWEFSDYYEANRERIWSEECFKYEITEEYFEALDRINNDESYNITVRILGDPENPDIDYYHSHAGEDEATQDTGDNRLTVEDAIRWLYNGEFIEYKDYSTDKNDCYIPAFAQFATMEDEKVGGFLVGKEIIKFS